MSFIGIEKVSLRGVLLVDPLMTCQKKAGTKGGCNGGFWRKSLSREVAKCCSKYRSWW